MSDPSPPVVLVHGLATSTRRTWVDTGFTDLLADEGRSFEGIDLPGHGGTEPLRDDEWDRLDDWLLDRLPAGPLDAVGFSMGARLLLSVAGRDPGRFRRLVVAGVGANLFRSDGEGEQLADALAAGGAAAYDHPVVGHFAALADASGADLTAVAALLRARQRPLDDLLGAITAEVLVVLGDGDFVGPADPLMERLPAASRLVPLRGVDHFATPKSMGFLDAALSFLAGG